MSTTPDTLTQTDNHYDLLGDLQETALAIGALAAGIYEQAPDIGRSADQPVISGCPSLKMTGFAGIKFVPQERTLANSTIKGSHSPEVQMTSRLRIDQLDMDVLDVVWTDETRAIQFGSNGKLRSVRGSLGHEQWVGIKVARPTSKPGQLEVMQISKSGKVFGETFLPDLWSDSLLDTMDINEVASLPPHASHLLHRAQEAVKIAQSARRSTYQAALVGYSVSMLTGRELNQSFLSDHYKRWTDIYVAASRRLAAVKAEAEPGLEDQVRSELLVRMRESSPVLAEMDDDALLRLIQ